LRAIYALAAALAFGVSASERRACPGFTLHDSHGVKRGLGHFRGDVVILNFWATWCRPCRAEIRWLNEIHREYSGRGVSVVGIAMDERGWPAVKPFLAEHGVTYPVLLGNARLARQFGGLDALPHTVFLDRRGRIVANHNAALGPQQLRKIVEILLADRDQ
jgi:cytochrome c biogenesis protein CcmG/thiol:disulfide interchange protein DsbE